QAGRAGARRTRRVRSAPHSCSGRSGIFPLSWSHPPDDGQFIQLGRDAVEGVHAAPVEVLQELGHCEFPGLLARECLDEERVPKLDRLFDVYAVGFHVRVSCCSTMPFRTLSAAPPFLLTISSMASSMLGPCGSAVPSPCHVGCRVKNDASISCAING